MRSEEGPMLTAGGKTVWTTADEIVDPRRTAVLVVDMQNDLCAEGGVFHTLGYDLSPARRVISPIGELLNAARRARAPIVYVMMTTYPSYESWAPSYIRFNLQQLRLPQGVFYTQPGTWGWRAVDELAPHSDDLVVSKWRSSGFIGTNLDMMLRGRGIETVVVCGIATYACVESTVRDAMHLDYYPVVAPECVSGYDLGLHEAALQIMRSRIVVLPLEQILTTWSSTVLTAKE
jgi:nicotinamidase-related amidase